MDKHSDSDLGIDLHFYTPVYNLEEYRNLLHSIYTGTNTCYGVQ